MWRIISVAIILVYSTLFILSPVDACPVYKGDAIVITEVSEPQGR